MSQPSQKGNESLKYGMPMRDQIAFFIIIIYFVFSVKKQHTSVVWLFTNIPLMQGPRVKQN